MTGQAPAGKARLVSVSPATLDLELQVRLYSSARFSSLRLPRHQFFRSKIVGLLRQTMKLRNRELHTKYVIAFYRVKLFTYRKRRYGF